MTLHRPSPPSPNSLLGAIDRLPDLFHSRGVRNLVRFLARFAMFIGIGLIVCGIFLYLGIEPTIAPINFDGLAAFIAIVVGVPLALFGYFIAGYATNPPDDWRRIQAPTEDEPSPHQP